ncbi:MAG: NAD-dependent epimerase/dehydratase family protein [Oscillospiraceae bacterium]|nr:NAD-dependent epimerase/dehydratase family protein [Oscillospiraceae bacterium]
MKILILGGTRFFGIQMTEELIRQGHEITVATRQLAKDPYGNSVSRIKIERTDPVSMENAFRDKKYDVVYDKIAYCSNDIKYAMDAINCDRYIYMSSTAVYEPKTFDTKEDDFDGRKKSLVWCARPDFPYDEIKRQAECALCQAYPDRNWTAVRYPFVIGEDDYTKRLLFYVEHTMKSIPMNIDNADRQMGYIRSDEAGKFLAFLADKNLSGAVNGSSNGTISLREIIDYVEKKTGTKTIISPDGDNAPYNGEPEYSINTDKAESLGFKFSDLKDWIFDLLDYYITQVKNERI